MYVYILLLLLYIYIYRHTSVHALTLHHRLGLPIFTQKCGWPWAVSPITSDPWTFISSSELPALTLNSTPQSEPQRCSHQCTNRRSRVLSLLAQYPRKVVDPAPYFQISDLKTAPTQRFDGAVTHAATCSREGNHIPSVVPHHILKSGCPTPSYQVMG